MSDLTKREAIEILAAHLPEPPARDPRSARRRALDARRLEIQRRLADGERVRDLADWLNDDPRIGPITPRNLRVLLSRAGILTDTPDPKAPAEVAWRSGFGPVRRP